MPSTYLLQQMVVDHPKRQPTQTTWGKSVEELRELLSLESLAKVERERPSQIRTYIEEQLAHIPNDKDQRYAVAQRLHKKTKALPRAHDALRVILCYL